MDQLLVFVGRGMEAWVEEIVKKAAQKSFFQPIPTPPHPPQNQMNRP